MNRERCWGVFERISCHVMIMNLPNERRKMPRGVDYWLYMSHIYDWGTNVPYYMDACIEAEKWCICIDLVHGERVGDAVHALHTTSLIVWTHFSLDNPYNQPKDVCNLNYTSITNINEHAHVHAQQYTQELIFL